MSYDRYEAKTKYTVEVKQCFNPGAFSPIVESWTWAVRAPAGHKIEEGIEYTEAEAKKAAETSANLHHAQKNADYFEYEYDPSAA